MDNCVINVLCVVCVCVFAEWQPEHTERQLANVDGVSARLSRHSLSADIDRYQLAEYRDNYCKVSCTSRR